MDPSQLYLDPQQPFIQKDGKNLTDFGWKFLHDLQMGLSTIDLATQTTGILPANSGGTGVNNSVHTITLGGNIATSGLFNLVLTLTGPTSITLPTSGSLKASQVQRVTTGSVGAGASALITLTWPVAFPDTNYSVVASVVDSTAAALSLSVVHVETVSASAVAVRVVNNSAGALTGSVNAIAVHD